jgi:hypothetical protein
MCKDSTDSEGPSKIYRYKGKYKFVGNDYITLTEYLELKKNNKYLIEFDKFLDWNFQNDSDIPRPYDQFNERNDSYKEIENSITGDKIQTMDDENIIYQTLIYKMSAEYDDKVLASWWDLDSYSPGSENHKKLMESHLTYVGMDVEEIKDTGKYLIYYNLKFKKELKIDQLKDPHSPDYTIENVKAEDYFPQELKFFRVPSHLNYVSTFSTSFFPNAAQENPGVKTPAHDFVLRKLPDAAADLFDYANDYKTYKQYYRDSVVGEVSPDYIKKFNERFLRKKIKFKALFYDPAVMGNDYVGNVRMIRVGVDDLPKLKEANEENKIITLIPRKTDNKYSRCFAGDNGEPYAAQADGVNIIKFPYIFSEQKYTWHQKNLKMQAHNTESDNPLLNMPDFLNMENLDDPIDSDFKETIVGPWYNIKKILINNTNGPQTINGSKKKNINFLSGRSICFILFHKTRGPFIFPAKKYCSKKSS